MASTLGYASKTDLENLLLINIDSSFNSQIDAWISAAEQEVNNYLGFTTSSGVLKEEITGEINDARVDGDLNLVIYPRKRPIETVKSIAIIKGSDSISLSLTNSDGDAKYTIPVQKDVIIYPNFELTISTASTLTRFADIKYSRFFTKISYIAGYSSVPKPIKVATTLYTADIFMRQANKEGLLSITQGRVSKTWAETEDGESSFIKQAKRMLRPYRIASGYW